jgi:hypothetical protein
MPQSHRQLGIDDLTVAVREVRRVTGFSEYVVRGCFAASQQPAPETPIRPKCETSQTTFCSTGFSRNLETYFARAVRE